MRSVSMQYIPLALHEPIVTISEDCITRERSWLGQRDCTSTTKHSLLVTSR